MKIVSLCIVTLVALFAIGGADPSPAPTADVPAAICDMPADSVAAGGSCGGNTCGKNQHCCNASCGWCVPIGMECPQIACGVGMPDPDDVAF